MADLGFREVVTITRNPSINVVKDYETRATSRMVAIGEGLEKVCGLEKAKELVMEVRKFWDLFPRPYMSFFYEPGVKCAAENKFDSPTDVDVIIPINQAPSDFWYFVVDSQFHKTADSVPYVSRRITALNEGEIKTSSVISALDEIKEPSDKINKLFALAEEKKAQPPARVFDWGVMELNSPLYLRFPCYNHSLRVLHKLAVDFFQGYAMNANQGYADFVANGKVTPLVSKQIDWKVYFLVYYWDNWERLNLDWVLRLDWFSQSARHNNIPYKQASKNTDTYEQLKKKTKTFARWAQRHGFDRLS